MLHTETPSVSSPHFAMNYRFESFFQKIQQLTDDKTYTIEEYDYR